MEARAYPRSSLRLMTELVCVDSHTHHKKYVKNISRGGLFISGNACGSPGTQLGVSISPMNGGTPRIEHFSASIVRTGNSGFALQFSHIDDKGSRFLEELMRPRWDGRNVFDGLLIVAARENPRSLSECLRLSSLVCGNYRYNCSVNHANRLRGS